MSTATAGGRRGWLRWLAGAAAARRWLGLAAVATALAGAGLDGLLPWAVRAAVDAVVAGPGATRTGFGAAAAVLAGVGVARFAGSVARRWLAASFSLAVTHDLRARIAGAIGRMDARTHAATPTGRTLSRTTQDLQLVQTFLASVPNTVGTVALVVVSFAGMLALSPLLGVVALAVLPLIALLTERARRTLLPATRTAQRRVAALNQAAEETIVGIGVVRAFGREERTVDELSGCAGALRSARLESARRQARLAPTLSVLPVLGQLAVFGVGGVLVLDGRIGVGSFVAVAAYLALLVGPARQLAGTVVAAQLARTGVERVRDVVDTRPARPPGDEPVAEGPLGVALDDVTVRLGDITALRRVRLDVAPGETVAVLGATGAGKSALLGAVAAVHPASEGTVRVGPSDVAQLCPDRLRAAVGVLEGSPYLVRGDVRDNLRLADADATDETMTAALGIAGLGAEGGRLPGGLGTAVGEGGSLLSGGQRQRVALARAVLREPRILLLDDAFAALDTVTEAEVIAALAPVLAGRTVLMVPCSRAALGLADRAVVIEEGRIVDVGEPAAVLARSGDDLLPAGPRTPDLDTGGDAAPRPDPLDEPGPAPAAPDVTIAPGSRSPDRPHPARLGRLLHPVRWWLAGAALLVLAEAGLAALPPRLGGAMLDAVGRGDLDRHGWLLAAGLAAAVLGWPVTWAHTRLTAHACERVLYALRTRIYAHVPRLDQRWFERRAVGHILTAMTADVDSLAMFLQTGLVITAVALATLVAVLGVMLATDLALTAAVCSALPLAAVAAVLFRAAVTRRYEQARDHLGTLQADLRELLVGLRTYQLLGATGTGVARVVRASAVQTRTQARAQRAVSVFFPALGLLSDAASLAVLAVAALRLGPSAPSAPSAGQIATFLLYLGMFFAPLQQLAQVFDSWQRGTVGLRRVQRLLAERSTTTPADEGLAPGRLDGQVRLADVDFAYDTGRAALEEVSLDVPPGQTVALVGGTGSGKSTVLKLIARWYDPSAGRVLVDDVDVRRYDPPVLRRRLLLVGQDPVLFSGTVLDNVCFGSPEAGPADVEAVLRRIGAWERLGRRWGLAREVGEHGGRLSDGERQLVALARAELVGPDVLLLDEATASLDAGSESAVMAALDRLSTSRTTVMVAHRLATAARADRVVVLRDGRVVQDGSPEELLAADGAYADLWSAADQNGGEDGAAQFLR